MRYPFGSDGKLINHLLFMDDLKLFGCNEHELKKLVDVVGVCSRGIGAEFGWKWCESEVRGNCVAEWGCLREADVSWDV